MDVSMQRALGVSAKSLAGTYISLVARQLGRELELHGEGCLYFHQSF